MGMVGVGVEAAVWRTLMSWAICRAVSLGEEEGRGCLGDGLGLGLYRAFVRAFAFG